MSEIISQAALRQLLDAWLGQGRGVVGPAAGQARAVALPAACMRPPSCCWKAIIRPANSIKETVFPRHEKLYGFRLQGKQVELVDAAGRGKSSW